MPRLAQERSALEVKRLRAPGMHAVGGVPGLYLQVLPTGARTWVLRVMVGGRRRDMGLGGYPAVSLARARESAREARERVRLGADPIEDRRVARDVLAARSRAAMTFRDCAVRLIESKIAGWRSAVHARQWSQSLRDYAFPSIGLYPVDQIGLPEVLLVLERDDFWYQKPETASRVRGRLEAVLDWAAVHGYRDAANPARWKGQLDKVLPAPRAVRSVTHYPALPIEQVPEFMSLLRDKHGTVPRALEVLILTCVRLSELQGMRWDELDLVRRVWVVPAARMKANREHRVPLSPRVCDILAAQPRAAELVFPAQVGMLSGAAFRGCLRGLVSGVTVHGFRSTFRDWVSEETSYPGELAEAALAHAVRGRVEAAYRRGDLFERRRLLMDAWSAYCGPPA